MYYYFEKQELCQKTKGGVYLGYWNGSAVFDEFTRSEIKGMKLVKKGLSRICAIVKTPSISVKNK